MAAARSRLGRVAGCVFRFAPGRRSGYAILLGGISVIFTSGITAGIGRITIPLLAVLGLRLASASTFLAFARISRLSRSALLRRKLPRLFFQGSVVFFSQKAVRLTDRRRSYGIIRQPDAFG
jgi:hypothetical protein